MLGYNVELYIMPGTEKLRILEAANLFQQSMQLPSSGQARVVILLCVAALPAHWDEAPVAVAVGECHPVLAKHPRPQCINLPITLMSLLLLSLLLRIFPSL